MVEYSRIKLMELNKIIKKYEDEINLLYVKEILKFLLEIEYSISKKTVKKLADHYMFSWDFVDVFYTDIANENESKNEKEVLNCENYKYRE